MIFWTVDAGVGVCVAMVSTLRSATSVDAEGTGTGIDVSLHVSDAGVRDDGVEDSERESMGVSSPSKRSASRDVSRDSITAPCLRCCNLLVDCLVRPKPSRFWCGSCETVVGTCSTPGAYALVWRRCW